VAPWPTPWPPVLPLALKVVGTLLVGSRPPFAGSVVTACSLHQPPRHHGRTGHAIVGDGPRRGHRVASKSPATPCPFRSSTARFVAPSRKRCRSSPRRSSAWLVEAAPPPKRRRVRPPPTRPLPTPVKTRSGPRGVGSVGGRSSTAGCRGRPRGRRLRHQARLPAFIDVAVLLGHVVHGRRGVVHPPPPPPFPA
jgi:hypothetical protein